MRLTYEVVRALAHQTMKGFELVKTLATEVLESRAEIARLTKERDDARVNSDKWLKLTKAAECMFQQDADSHADFCARAATGRDKP
jgi:hypothetical protein